MNARTERTIAFNRKNILEAADKLFSESGVEKTTMDQLAAAAGYSKPTLYGYFKDKEEVFFALVCDFMKKLAGKVEKIISDSCDYREKFIGVCNAVFRLANRYPLYFEGLIGKINVNVNTEETPQVYKEIYLLGQSLNANLEKLIVEGQQEGFFDDSLDSVALLYFFWSSISGVIRMALQKTDYLKMLNFDKKQFAEFCFERLLVGCKSAK